MSHSPENRDPLDVILTGIEKAWVGESWAMKNSTFGQRLWFYRVTGSWPQGSNQLFDELSLQRDIDATTNPECEMIKLQAARALGLNVRPKR